MKKGRHSGIQFKQLVWELQDLMDIPREVKRSKGGFRYEYPTKGREVLQALVKVMAAALHRGEQVQIRGFGTFKVVDSPYKVVNRAFLGNLDGKLIGQAQIPIPLPPRKVVVFKPSIHLQAMINPENPSWMQRRAMKTWKKI